MPPVVVLCYTITMTDPLAPTTGASARLILAGAMVAIVWLGVAWAIW